MENNAKNADKPLLSVVVPVYGVEDYLGECIESIQHQSYDNLEIILVDDGSKGREGKICDKYAADDPRIVVIHKTNEGQAAARNTGIQAAKADYITFIDGDDFIAEDQYKKMMSWVIKEDPDLVAVILTDYKGEDNKKEILQNMENGVYSGESLTFFWRNMHCYGRHYYDLGVLNSACTKIFKRSILMQYISTIPYSFRLGEDCALTFPYMLKCTKIVIDNRINGYYYRNVGGSMSKKRHGSLFSGIVDLYDFLLPYYAPTNDRLITDQLELYRISLIDMALGIWMNDLEFKNIHKTTAELKKSIEDSGLSVAPSVIDSFALPFRLKWKLKCIFSSKWHIFEMTWIVTRILLFPFRAIKNMIRLI